MPHVVGRSEGAHRKVVVIGAGPAGLEAARVCAERGHAVVLFEAADQPGGQVRLAARTRRRAELLGIADWRAAQCEKHGVQLRFNHFAEAADVLDEAPDVVIVATGGLPNTDLLEEGEDLVVSSWDILTGDAKPGHEVLLYDDNGAHPGLQAAEFLAEAGARLEIVSPERFFAPEIGGLNHVAYARCFQEHDVQLTINTRLIGVQREGNRLAAILGSDYTERTARRLVDQVVVEHGTLPLDELYFALKEQSANRGEVDYRALIAGRPQQVATNPDGRFQLFRVGDAVSSRNIHAAIYDALRLCKDL
jgi:NADPH-dependent 2,4-dienoyl-CoA reductase/sulfur reductase-like enzyme